MSLNPITAKLVRWHGNMVRAIPIGQRSDGSWLMRAPKGTPRILAGGRIVVQPSEIIGSVQKEE